MAFDADLLFEVIDCTSDQVFAVGDNIIDFQHRILKAGLVVFLQNHIGSTIFGAISRKKDVFNCVPDTKGVC